MARAQVLEDVAVLLVDADPSSAVAHLDRALADYHSAGAARDVDRVRRRLRELGVYRRRATRTEGSPDPHRLTDSELAVARLVAQGLTNRAAAQRLYLSPHTVGSHLRHIFEKLNINSRVELAARFARRADEHDARAGRSAGPERVA
jgi:DNA-binding CsgD family transcriptional regulator